MALPLLLRNALAELILASLYDEEARRALGVMATLWANGHCEPRFDDLPPRMQQSILEGRDGPWDVGSDWKQHAADLRERSSRAWRATEKHPLGSRDATLEDALDAAALLFDAGLYFEVHELLEPRWLRADGNDRNALQGLIQIAVGFEHLANGNAKGGRALLASGIDKIHGRILAGLDLDQLAVAVRTYLTDAVSLRGGLRPFDPTAAPQFSGRR